MEKSTRRQTDEDEQPFDYSKRATPILPLRHICNWVGWIGSDRRRTALRGKAIVRLIQSKLLKPDEAEPVGPRTRTRTVQPFREIFHRFIIHSKTASNRLMDMVYVKKRSEYST